MITKNSQGFAITSLDRQNNFGEKNKANVVFDYKGYEISFSHGVVLVDILICKGKEEHYIRGDIEEAIKKVDELTEV